MGWVKQSEDKSLPEWLQESLDAYCLCGTEKENFYNSEGKCTNRRCPNKTCPYTLAQRIADMCVLLGVSGIKEGKAIKLVKEHGLQIHYEALPFILQEKPTISLSLFLRISFISGIDKRWESICGGLDTLEEFLSNDNGKYNGVLHEYKKELRYGSSFVQFVQTIKPDYEPLIIGNVMLSGNIKGFANRDDFIHALNQQSKGLLHLNITGKRKTDVLCLIQESDEPYRSKAQVALDNGIPIKSPTEFLEFITNELSNKLGRSRT